MLLPAAQAQRVEVVGLAASFNISQSWLREPGLQLGAYQLGGNAGARFDDTGNRFSAYSRIRLGEGAFFVQPELAYTSVLSSRYDLSYPGDPGPPSAPDYQPPTSGPFGYRIRRADVAVLAGWHLNPRFYVVAGPVLARQLRQQITASQIASNAVFSSLYEAVERQQLLAQVGVGLQVWRLDLGLRYEQSLTPYSRQITYAGQTQGFHQRTNQLIFSAGVLLYDRSRRWRK
ncbi:hypothetical protein A8B98_03930 [Hymenobacter sp. UV11]|nr:hypothetical protein A8B98_03930 [Hymenobacter sp. UV11]